MCVCVCVSVRMCMCMCETWLVILSVCERPGGEEGERLEKEREMSAQLATSAHLLSV